MVAFADRIEAGRLLAQQLARFRGPDLVVLGLPRGGVPVAAQVARELGAPLDVIVVRKLGVPYQPELAMGALGEDGVRVIDEEILRLAGVRPEDVVRVEARERAELEDRVRRFRPGRPRLDLTGRIALLIDDGIATGSTARAACLVARHLGARRVIVAAPVGAPGVEHRLPDADEVVCLAEPPGFTAVGNHYRDFSPTSDEEVVALLRAAGTEGAAYDEKVLVPVAGCRLEGHLVIPPGAPGLVVFAHGSGSSRHSPRNRYVADVLQAAGLGTLLIDLLTPEEEQDRARVFDIGTLAARLIAATDWLVQQPAVDGLSLGYFGASTGAAAALVAAAGSERVAAVVSRGGRPDLAGHALAAVRAPTLLIVGGDDRAVLELNRAAQARLRCPTELVVVPGATHLFEEPGTLAQAASFARDWFVRHLGRRGHEPIEEGRP
ncbi:phosphoribosyltransferase family protein [Longivirga aurantiaca]|uniref:Phosphoribosyltransferase family protein n=1 Tax=Longivirga aurantiaca TaxID=1837743 RepID=A0ABW1T158_9ACTN